jgi:hypothetical protein
MNNLVRVVLGSLCLMTAFYFRFGSHKQPVSQ